MCLVRSATEVAWDYTVLAIFCMAAYISASWTLTLLPLLWLLLPKMVLATAISVGEIDTVRPWFLSSSIFLSWIANLSSNAAMYSIAAVLASDGAKVSVVVVFTQGGGDLVLLVSHFLLCALNFPVILLGE